MKKTLALLLAVIMCLGVLSACGQKEQPAPEKTPEPTPQQAATPTPEPQKPEETQQPEQTEPGVPEFEFVDVTAPTIARPAKQAAEKATEDTPLVVGYSPFSNKFSPFFSETAYDQDVQAMTQIGLLNSDRTGAIINNGIKGETVDYNGTAYTYYGPADLKITEAEDGKVYYDFNLRKDLVFSDGEPLTVDDVIFTMYVLCDPTYDGSSTLYAQPIEGMEAYRSGMDNLANLIITAGRGDGYVANDYFTEDEYNAFWSAADDAVLALAEDITDYCMTNYASYGAVDVASSAGLWGFSIPDDGTAEDFAAALWEAYGDDVLTMIGTEKAGKGLSDLFPTIEEYTGKGVQTGESAPNITGIQKMGENGLRIVMTEVDATAIYQLGVSITPMHYYGDPALYDYENNSFGFPKGDLSSVRAKTTQPMGAGAYKFIKFEDGVVYFEANENYFLGAPYTKYINFQQCTADEDKLNGITTGTVDISDPSFSNANIDAIKKANGGELSGDVIDVNTVDNLGYGYIGLAASRVNVGGEIDSDASKNLRKAIATVLAVYRDVAVDSYYGDRASVINYPISNTSWAAPRSTDDGYKLAFSVDVDGKDIYTSSMSAEDKYAAALQASLGFFEAAGYTVEGGKLTAAPDGAALEYECWIPGDGIGDHPSFMIITEAHDALATIGFNLIIKDLSNSSDLWDALDADEVDMWCAAWGSTVDPDMYQVYHSSNVVGLPGSTGSNHYFLQDAELDELILDARASTDQAYRKIMYKACLDIIVDWAVEVPVYQRQNAIIFSAERVNLDTITPDITTFYGWMREVENTTLQ